MFYALSFSIVSPAETLLAGFINHRSLYFLANSWALCKRKNVGVYPKLFKPIDDGNLTDVYATLFRRSRRCRAADRVALPILPGI